MTIPLHQEPNDFALACPQGGHHLPRLNHMDYKQLEILLSFLRAAAQDYGTQEVTCLCGYIGMPSGTLKTDVVEVSASRDCLMLEILRVENQNPVVQVNTDGKIIRTHGEFRYVQDALLEILAKHGITADVLAAHGIL